MRSAIRTVLFLPRRNFRGGGGHLRPNIGIRTFEDSRMPSQGVNQSRVLAAARGAGKPLDRRPARAGFRRSDK
jgi:hypothetical protein